MKKRHVSAIAAAVAALLSAPSYAQLSTATVTGQVVAGSTAQEGASITATNTATGRTLRTESRAGGAYTLVGLEPGTYRIDVTAADGTKASDVIEAHVGQTLQLDMDVTGAAAQNAQLETVVIVGVKAPEVKTSEVSTSVSAEQLENLPQVTRNFLSFADLAPACASRKTAPPAT
ncbi:MAG: carboxypeptidase-like regulatory domain-containing protein [Steroidobacteraceae bacterium]